jgi:hypothetical protein
MSDNTHRSDVMLKAMQAQTNRIAELEAKLLAAAGQSFVIEFEAQKEAIRIDALREAAQVCYDEADRCNEIPRATTCNQMGCAILDLIEGEKT